MQTDFLPEHLPAWMLQPRRSIDWGLLLAAALGLLAAWTFFVRPGIPAHNGLLHSAFMAADIGDALREGQLFPRWSPHAFGGLGAPIPVFYPQGAAYMVALVDELLTGDLGTALRVVLACALVGAAAGQYLFCRIWTGATPALLAAGLYVFSPILGLTASHIAGDLEGTVGIALLPFVLWSGTRASRAVSRWDVALAAVLFAVLLYVHIPLAGACAFVLVGLAAFADRAALQPVFLALAAGIGLFTPFWLPALSERDAVRWEAPAVTTTAFVSLTDLFAPPPRLDPMLLNPKPLYSLGLLLPAFAAAGLAGAFQLRRRRRFALLIIAAAVVSAAAALAMRAAWPTYLLTLCTAALGGLALEWRSMLPSRLRRAALPGALVCLIVVSMPVWLIPLYPTTDDVSPVDQIDFEQRGLGVAASLPLAPVPTTLRPGMPPERTLIESYQAPPLVRIRPGTPVRVTPISGGTHRSTWQVSTTVPNSITLSLAHFPGWQAELDGEFIPAERAPDSGLLRVMLPPTTNGTLNVTLGATPQDGLGLIIAASAAGFLLLHTRLSPGAAPYPAPSLNVQEARLTAFALTFAGVVLLTAAVPSSAFPLRAEPYSVLRNAMPITAISGPVRLMAYEFDRTRAAPGDTLPVTLYWSATSAPNENYGVRLTLIDIDRQITYPTAAIVVPGGLHTRRWLPGYVLIDRHDVALPDDLIPGTYQISVEGFTCSPNCDLTTPLRFRDPQGIARLAVTLPIVFSVGG